MANVRQFMAARTAAWSGKHLPYLRRVAYLESSGTQRIDTGYSPISTSFFSVKFSILSASYNTRWALVYGAYGNDRPTTDCQLGFGNDGNYLRLYNRFCINLDGNNLPDESAQLVLNTEYDVTAKKGLMVVNGENYRQTTGTIEPHPDTIHLFGSSVDVSFRYLIGRIFSWSVRDTQDGDVIKSFIPVLDLNGRPAMYDEVSGRFFHNQGTGEFTWRELET